MQIPFRLAAALHSRRSVGMLLALGFSTVVLVSTPFLIPEVATEFDVGLTGASLVSVVQLAGFAIGSWGSGRLLTPQRSVLATALVASVVVNLVMALLPPFTVFLLLRLGSGVSLGVITWFAWANAFGNEQTMSRVAVVGPVIAVGATPGLVFVIDGWGLQGLFLVLGILPLLPLLFIGGVPLGVRQGPAERHRARPTARVVLVALTLFSFGGSAVFTFGVAIGGSELGIASGAAAVGYTLNAVVSIPSAGWKGRRPVPSVSMGLTAVCAFFLATAYADALFYGAIIAWGFFYWLAIPGVFKVLAAASAYPEERAGDAQAMMAVGRIGGPFLGGVLLDTAGPLSLGIAGAALMSVAAAAVFAVRTAT